MKVSFHGACREVTGSCILIETGKTKFLVDCGMFQDDKSTFKNEEDFAFNPSEIDFVLLTHAHVDHCGRVPKLYKDGFRGKIYCSQPTREISRAMLLDSANVFLKDKKISPIYFENDVWGVMPHFQYLPYNKETAVSSDVRIKLRDAGHVLGSVVFEVLINKKKLVFSGDLGNYPAPIVRDPEIVAGADVVFLESTYGYGVHEPREAGREKLKQAIIDTANKKGVLMIPVFALERSQEMIFELKRLLTKGEIPPIPVFLDSPLASQVTDIYREFAHLFDEEAMKLMGKGEDLFDFRGLKFVKKPGQAKKISKAKGAKIVLAGSGMCDGGRIGSYLKKNLDNSRNKLLLVSFQVEGTLGSVLAGGAKEVKIEKQRVRVRADVSSLSSFSSHADQRQLAEWVSKIKNPQPKTIFLNHGEEKSILALKEVLEKELRINCCIPELKKEYSL
jgi:metallo-beta-lactamase family protein